MTQEQKKLTRLSQAELNKIITKHELFRSGRPGGVRANLSHHDLSGLVLREHDLSHADFTSAILYQADLEKCKLDYCQFFATDCREANFRGASMVRVDLRGACLRGASMNDADLTDADMREGSFATFDPDKGLSFVSDNPEWKEGVGGVDLRGATLVSAKLSGTIATNSNFEDANLSKSVFIRGDLSGANLAGANLVGADLSTCTLKNVNLRGANLVGAKMDFLGLENVDLSGALTEQPVGKTLDQLQSPLEQLVLVHKVWLDSKGRQGQRLDLNGYDLRSFPILNRVDLTMLAADNTVWYEYDFTRMNLQASQFRGSDMRNCTFDAADLRGSNFSKANMVSAKLKQARLEPLLLDGGRLLKTNFAGANLRYSDFSGANLRGVDFSGTDLSFAVFTDADLRGADFHDANLEKASLTLDDAMKKAALAS